MMWPMTNTPTNQQPGPDAPWPRVYRSRTIPNQMLRYHDLNAPLDSDRLVPVEYSATAGEFWQWIVAAPESEINPDEWQYVPPSVEGWYEGRHTGSVCYVEDGADAQGYYRAMRYVRIGGRCQCGYAVVNLSGLTRLDGPPAWINQENVK